MVENQVSLFRIVLAVMMKRMEYWTNVMQISSLPSEGRLCFGQSRDSVEPLTMIQLTQMTKLTQVHL